jgi:hypothetical protein
MLVVLLALVVVVVVMLLLPLLLLLLLLVLGAQRRGSGEQFSPPSTLPRSSPGPFALVAAFSRTQPWGQWQAKAAGEGSSMMSATAPQLSDVAQQLPGMLWMAGRPCCPCCWCLAVPVLDGGG